MTGENFHIKRNGDKEESFLLHPSDENNNHPKLFILPFEAFHQSLFALAKKTPRYHLPEESAFDLIPANVNPEKFNSSSEINIQSRVSKEEYIQTVNEIKKNIHRGDIYEMNFCFEFFAENVEINPFHVFEKLVEKNKAPYSSLTKINDLFIICATPERFLKKTGNQIIAQPMKGTAPRFDDAEQDEKSKTALQHDEKEQNENVMIVDLVRNDLSRIAKKGTVKVEELFGIHTFQNIHQMVSTISCENNNHSFNDILDATFPMGSMTGAPKKRVLELTNQYEKTARGIYSGTIGILQPNGDFDLHVVIRTIIYDKKNKYLSFSVGSAITDLCSAEIEYEECLLKAKSLIEVLKN